MSKETDIALMQKAAEMLSEHFDTVQIFTTRHDASEKEGKTICGNLGLGNWYARYGQVVLWTERGKEQERINERSIEDSHEQ